MTGHSPFSIFSPTIGRWALPYRLWDATPQRDPLFSLFRYVRAMPVPVTLSENCLSPTFGLLAFDERMSGPPYTSHTPRGCVVGRFPVRCHFVFILFALQVPVYLPSSMLAPLTTGMWVHLHIGLAS